MILSGMSYDLLMDREIVLREDAGDKAPHFISPGGYSLNINGKEINFDFNNIDWDIDAECPSLIHVSAKGLDVDYSPESKEISPDSFESGLFKEFFCSTEPDVDEAEIHPVSVSNLCLSFSGRTGVNKSDVLYVDASKELLDSANKALTDGSSVKPLEIQKPKKKTKTKGIAR